MSSLQLVAWIAGGIMFATFILEALVSYFILRHEHYAIGDTFLNVGITAGYVLARLGIGAFVAVIPLPPRGHRPAQRCDLVDRQQDDRQQRQGSRALHQLDHWPAKGWSPA